MKTVIYHGYDDGLYVAGTFARFMDHWEGAERVSAREPDLELDRIHHEWLLHSENVHLNYLNDGDDSLSPEVLITARGAESGIVLVKKTILTVADEYDTLTAAERKTLQASYLRERLRRRASMGPMRRTLDTLLHFLDDGYGPYEDERAAWRRLSELQKQYTLQH